MGGTSQNNRLRLAGAAAILAGAAGLIYAGLGLGYIALVIAGLIAIARSLRRQ